MYKEKKFLSLISKKGDVTNAKSRLFSLTDVKALGNWGNDALC